MKKHRSIFILVMAVSTLFACSKSKSDPAPAGTGKFIFNGTAYSGPATATNYNGTVYVTISGGNGKTMTIYNVPSSNSGASDLYNAFQTGVDDSKTEAYGSSDIEIANLPSGSVSLNGTLTKTGARSFVFAGVFQADLSSKSTVEVSGSASY